MIGAWLDEWSEKLGFSPNKSSSDLQLVGGDGDGNGGGPAIRRASSTAQRSLVREQHALIAEYTAALAVMTDEVCQLDGELEAQRCAARDERRAAEVREQESAAHVATLTQKNATMRVDVKTLQGKLAAAEQALAAAQGRAAALEETLAKQALSSQNSDAEMAALDEATRGRRMSGSGTVMSPTASQGRGAGGVDLTDTQGRLSLSPTSMLVDGGDRPPSRNQRSPSPQVDAHVGAAPPKGAGPCCNIT